MRSRDFFIGVIYSLIFVFILYFALVPIISVVLYGIDFNGDMEALRENAVRSWKYLKNSLWVATLTTTIATTMGVIMAFTLNRLKFTGRKILKVLVLLPLVNPPFVGGISFIMLFGRNGLITKQLLGLSTSPYGWHGIVFIQSLSLGTLAYLLISSAMSKTDTSLEEAARNLGSSEWTILKTITLPLMLPEIAGTALLVFLGSMADFSTPLVIGGSFRTLAADLYVQITGVYDMRSAALSGVFLLIPCLILFFSQRYFVSRRKYFSDATTTTDIEYKNMSRAGKRVLIGLTSAFLFLTFIQYFFIIIGAFTERWGYDYSFTLRHLEVLFETNLQPFVNSIKMSTTVAFFASSIGVILAYFIQTKRIYFKKAAEIVTILPAAVPGILFGIGYLVTFKYPLFGIGKYIFTDRAPIILLGTTIIVYIVSIARYMNVGFRSGYATLEHADPDLHRASYNLGAGEGRTFFTIMVPVMKEAFSASFIKNFATTMTSLGAIVLLLTPANKVAVQQIFQIANSSEVGKVASLSLLLSLCSLVFIGFFYMLFNLGEIITKVRELKKNGFINK